MGNKPMSEPLFFSYPDSDEYLQKFHLSNINWCYKEKPSIPNVFTSYVPKTKINGTNIKFCNNISGPYYSTIVNENDTFTDMLYNVFNVSGIVANQFCLNGNCFNMGSGTKSIGEVLPLYQGAIVLLTEPANDGGYPSSLLRAKLDVDTIDLIINKYGSSEKGEYSVIPDGNDLYHCYPKRSTFNFVIDIDSRPDLKKVLYDYSTNEIFFILNVNLNLLNRVTDKEYFDKLMLACLGSYQTNLSDVTYRFCNMNDEELQYYSDHQREYIIFKSFTSTSMKSLSSFGNTKMVIHLIRKKRNGAIYIRDYSQFPDEEEILLCAYSKFYINGVDIQKREIELTYLDYYEYNFQI